MQTITGQYVQCIVTSLCACSRGLTQRRSSHPPIHQQPQLSTIAIPAHRARALIPALQSAHACRSIVARMPCNNIWMIVRGLVGHGAAGVSRCVYAWMPMLILSYTYCVMCNASYCIIPSAGVVSLAPSSTLFTTPTFIPLPKHQHHCFIDQIIHHSLP